MLCYQDDSIINQDDSIINIGVLNTYIVLV